MKLTPIGRMEIFRQVLDQLSAYIDENDLQPGDRLPGDRTLVATLHVSRPVVQQALKVLEGLGRVTIVHGLGTFVADNGHRVAAGELLRGLTNDPALPSQVLAVRELVDTAVIRAAYEHDRPGVIRELRRVLEDRGQQLTAEPDEASLDLDFESVFGRFCNNPVLARLQTIAHHAWLETQISADGALPDRFGLHHDHEAILEALEREDLDEALRLFSLHMRELRP